MRPNRTWLSLVLIALILPSTGLRGVVAEDEKPEGDYKKIQGKWTAPSAGGDKVTYTIKGNKLKLVAPSRSYDMELTLDAKAKPTPTVDFKITEGPEDSKGKTSKGIYKFDGDKFVFCFSPQGDRPTEFETEGYEKIVVTLTPVKD